MCMKWLNSLKNSTLQSVWFPLAGRSPTLRLVNSLYIPFSSLFKIVLSNFTQKNYLHLKKKLLQLKKTWILIYIIVTLKFDNTFFPLFFVRQCLRDVRRIFWESRAYLWCNNEHSWKHKKNHKTCTVSFRLSSVRTYSLCFSPFRTPLMLRYS